MNSTNAQQIKEAKQDASSNTTPGFELGILAYSREGLDEIKRIVEQTGINSFLRIGIGNLSSPEKMDCEIAMAVMTGHDDVDRYLHDIASIQVLGKKPVIAILCESAKEVVGVRKSEIAAPDIVQLPVHPQEFVKVVMTEIASARIQQQSNDKLKLAGTPRPLGEILVEHRLISPLQLTKALEYQRGAGMRLGDALVALGFIDEQQKIRFLAGQLNVGLATPKQFANAELEVVALIAEHIAKRNKCIALEREDGMLTVAMTDVLNLQLLDNLRDSTELTINPVLATEEDIQGSIERYYRDISSQRDASDLMSELENDDVEYVQGENENDVSIEEAAAAGAELGIIKLVNMLIVNAVRDRASDIHVEPGEKELAIRYRIDGDLRRVMSPPKQSQQAIITRLKILSDLDIAERRLPQDGRLAVKVGRREVDVRLSILPTVFGEKAVMRILDKEAFEKSISNLGLSEQNIAIFRENISKPYGMVIVTGPTGSGKSSTLYSAVQTVKSVTKNIITVEDPVEFHMEGVSQVSVNSKIGMTFGAALRSILRQDPDIILIGEIRDNETADIATKMALTGHLVFSTLHTNDAASSIARFVDIGIPPLLLGSALNLIMAQRLVRRICPKCRAEYRPDEELIDQLKLDGSQDQTFYKGEGCVSCNGTGYSGRIGLFEMLNVTNSIRKLILKSAPTNEIQEAAVAEGMKTLRKAGIEKVLSGETTVEQVIAATNEL